MLTVDDSSFERDVLSSDRPVVVDFWAPWCRPCDAVTELLEELEASDRADRIRFAKLDIEASPETAARYDVLSIPTVIVFSEGEPRESVVGARSRRHFERALAPWLA
jgi:thioredoxin 1